MKREWLTMEQGWSTFILAWILVITSAYTIWQAELTNGMQVLLLIGTAAYIAGYFLARSAFSWRVAASFSLVYGLFFITFLIGRQFLPEDLSWPARVADLINRQQDWLGKAIGGGTSRDRLIFVMHTSIIYWVLGYTAAWFTYRMRRIWLVVLPSGIVLLSVVYYYFGPKPLWLYLTFYILIALLYIARTYLADQEIEWQLGIVRYERTITLNFLRSGLIVALVALMAAWMMPVMSANAAVGDALGGVNRPWREFQDNWTRLFSSLRSYGIGTNDAYGGSLPLGGPRNVSDTLVMDILVKDRLPYAYWKAGVFETYEDSNWEAPSGERTLVIPDEGLINTPIPAQHEIITATVRNYQPNIGTLFGLPQMVGTDQQMFVTQMYDARGASLVSLIQSRYVLQQGDVYQTQSRFSVADEASLRSAGTDYPDWIAPNLQLPDTITPETLALAEKLTAPYDNVYDKALAVQDYLRTNIEYNDQIEAPPPDVDAVHYVLFELQQGYCNYYASAMAVMLRSQGIPARLAVGYAAGEFIEEANVYRVRARDSHTWVEVYFPRYGWVPFEPTASLSTITRPSGEEGDTSSNFLRQFNAGLERNQFPSEEDFLDPNQRLQDNPPEFQGGDSAASGGWFAFSVSDPVAFFRTIAAVLVVLLSGVALYLANILNSRVEADVIQSYSRLGSWSRWLGLIPQPQQTPYERADMLSSAVPEGRQPIRNLTQRFVVTQFSTNGHNESLPETSEEWKRLRPLLIRKSLTRGWQQVRAFTRRRRFRPFR